MKMSYLHPSENTYNFTNADNLVAWAKANGLSMHGHTFIWHSEYQVPEWMVEYTGDWEAMLNEHVQTIAEHFADDVVSWDVVNEAFENTVSGYRNSIFYDKLGAEYIENAFITARAADPDADLYYNDYSIEAEVTKLDHVLAMVDDFQARDIPIDGIGFQMHVQIDWPSVSAISAAFQKVVDRGIKVKITELDIPLYNKYSSSPLEFDSYTAEAAQIQRDRYYDIVKAYMDTVPPAQRGGITIWGLRDGDSWLLSGLPNPDWPLLFSGELTGPYTAKLPLEGVADALSE